MKTAKHTNHHQSINNGVYVFKCDYLFDVVYACIILMMLMIVYGWLIDFECIYIYMILCFVNCCLVNLIWYLW